MIIENFKSISNLPLHEGPLPKPLVDEGGWYAVNEKPERIIREYPQFSDALERFMETKALDGRVTFDIFCTELKKGEPIGRGGWCILDNPLSSKSIIPSATIMVCQWGPGRLKSFKATISTPKVKTMEKLRERLDKLSTKDTTAVHPEGFFLAATPRAPFLHTPAEEDGMCITIFARIKEVPDESQIE
jgi:hypothetical protein